MSLLPPPPTTTTAQVGGAPTLPGGEPLRLKLPVAMHKFMAPEPGIAKEFFFDQWKAHQAPPCKAQEMVERPPATGPLSSEAIVGIMRSLHFGVEHGYLDPSPHNEAGAAYWACGPADQPAESLASAICCCRVEANPQNRCQFRVTVVSPTPAVAAAVHQLLAAQIRAAPGS